MLLGHIAAGLAAKRVTPKTPVVLLIVAGELVDILWPVFLLLGVETARIAPGNTVITPLDFVSYPWTHSLLGHCVWGCLLGGIVYAFRKDRKEAWVLAGVVVSHWVLDVISHRPDMPLVPGLDVKVGLGLWNSLPATLLVEYGLFAAGVAVYARTTRARNRVGSIAFWSFVAFMGLLYLGNIIGPPPPNIQMVAYAGIGAWVFYLWTWWFDRNREIVISGPGSSQG